MVRQRTEVLEVAWHWMERQGQQSEAGSGWSPACALRHGRQASIVGIPAPQIKPILVCN